MSLAAAKELSLVLTALGINHRLNGGGHQQRLWVADGDGDRAREALASYVRENSSETKVDATLTPRYGRSWAGLWMAIVILIVHAAAAGEGGQGVYVRAFGASAEGILSGELHRTATALLLHADGGHLAGNMVGCLIFGTAVCAWMGSGVGVLLILISGMAGNWLSAVVYQSGHTAIGASTAVFGALGILAAHQFISKIKQNKIKRRGKGRRAWLPLAAALALLGFLGASPRSDLLAHLFGLLAGLGIGAVITLIVSKVPKAPVQYICLCLSVALLVVAWVQGVRLAAI